MIRYIFKIVCHDVGSNQFLINSNQRVIYNVKTEKETSKYPALIEDTLVDYRASMQRHAR